MGIQMHRSGNKPPPIYLQSQALHTFRFTFREASEDVNTGAISLNYAQAQLTRSGCLPRLTTCSYSITQITVHCNALESFDHQAESRHV